jgi:feruloyl esterase
MPERTETVTDFTYRSIVVAAALGKEIAAAYYGSEPHHSYYNGCSSGGRQGISVAARYPDLFDGIVAGTPAVDWNPFLAAPAIQASYVASGSSSAISDDLWSDVIVPEVLNQCDALDGKVDGIIADTTLCSWNPDVLLCGPRDDTSTCLTQNQVDGLKKLYQPILGTNGTYLFPGYEPGSEADDGIGFPRDGTTSPLSVVSRSILDQSNRIPTLLSHRCV